MGKSKKAYLKNRQEKIERDKRKQEEYDKRQTLGEHKQVLHRQGKAPKQKKKRKLKNKWKKLVLSENLSLIDNAEGVLSDFNYYRKLLKSGYDIEFDLSHIKNIDPEGLAFLVANVADKNLVRNNSIKGNYPNDLSLTEMLSESGFFKFVRYKGGKPKVKHRLVHKTTDFKVEPKEAKEACLFAVKHTFNSEEKFRPIYEILIECMANTKNHAYKEGEAKYDWWKFVYKKEENVTAFTFLDLGVGIFNSYPVIHHMSLKKGLNKNINIIEDIFAGKIKSRTKKQQRGKGIPHIYEQSKNRHFSKFYLITNDVFVDLKTGNKKQLKEELNGTLYYWELTNGN